VGKRLATICCLWVWKLPRDYRLPISSLSHFLRPGRTQLRWKLEPADRPRPTPAAQLPGGSGSAAVRAADAPRAFYSSPSYPSSGSDLINLRSGERTNHF
jgi:hypothetical protein